MAIVAVVIAITPDPNIVGPVPLIEWIEVGLLGVAVVGLMLAWRWEAAGASLALLSIAAQDIIFRLHRGIWFHSMGNTAVLMLIFIIPAVLYLVCWYLSRDKAMERPSEVRPAS